jgi:hypothetical protein
MSSANHASILHMTQIEIREIPHDPRHTGVPQGVSKTISKLMVRSMQTMQLSCVKISTMSKRIETRFHLSLIT